LASMTAVSGALVCVALYCWEDMVARLVRMGMSSGRGVVWEFECGELGE
jgi:hypothetical protein